MSIQDLITKDVVKVPLVSHEKYAVIRELVQFLHDAGKIDDVDMVYNAVLDREVQGSTGLEQGIAVPHAKCAAVRSLVLAVGVSPDGIDFESLDGNKSHLFFMILAPPDKSGPHIQLLSEISGVVRSKAFCRMLRSAKDAEEVVELFQEE